MKTLANASTSFFLATSDSEVCKSFYTKNLGLTLRDDNQYALVFDLAGAELRIAKVPSFTPFAWTVLDWQIDDINACVDMLVDQGITFEQFEGMELNEKGIWTVPGEGTQIAWFKDPDGNVLSVSQRS